MDYHSVFSVDRLNDFFAPGIPIFSGEKKITAEINSNVFSNVPVEIIYKIFSYLTISELVVVRGVSRRFTILEGDQALFTFLAGILYGDGICRKNYRCYMQDIKSLQIELSSPMIASLFQPLERIIVHMPIGDFQ